MKASVLHSVLRRLARHSRWCIAESSLRALLPAENRNTFHVALSRHVRAGTLQRLSPGLYLNPYLPSPVDAAEQLAAYLRPDDFCYLSLESVLHERGWLAQVPNRLTFMTTGPSHTYHTAVGIVEFTHTRQPFAKWRPQTAFDRDRRMYIASPQLALADLTHVGRNLDLVEPEP